MPITNCRACAGANLTSFLDLGKQYLSDFRADRKKPRRYQLEAVFCHDCKLVQLSQSVPQAQMYHDRYGFKSGISQSIKDDLDSVVTHAFQYVNDPRRWLDIASNDGTLLSFVPADVYRVGVDPVAFLCAEAKPHADLIINDYFKDFDLEPFDVITSVSCFYDMPDPSQFVADVKSVLAAKGVWIIQQNYLLTTMQLAAVDNFCHEHLEYYSLLSLEKLLQRFDLEVVEVTTSMVNGGSIRTVVAHRGAYAVDESVWGQRSLENDAELASLAPYQEFAERVGGRLNQLYQLTSDLKAAGKSIAILAASTRGATIWQAASLGPQLIDYAVERNPAKVGKYFSAIGLPIIAEADFRARRPDYAIIGPWFFADEIIDREQDYLKNGGRLIKPLPEVEIIDGRN
jgi:NDP-4-keto-2,6-dideoxyhexose 3-C-methyltransferase